MTVVASKTGTKVLMKGTEAVGRAAILAGCHYYFGYPITPQSEIGEFLSRELPKIGGVFLQAESEVSAINMVTGAVASGARAMSSTSGPGYSLMVEGLSSLAGCDLPCMLVLVSRLGPGGGNVFPSQSEYNTVTKGGGHGGYQCIVLSPSSIQEMFDLVQIAFDLADKYRMTTILLTEGTLAQMMEPVELRRMTIGEDLPRKDWAITGMKGRGQKNHISAGFPNPGMGNAFYVRLMEKYRSVQENEVRFERYLMDDAEIAVVAFGSVARTAWAGVDAARAAGVRAGLIRPISLWPFPHDVITETSLQVRKMLVVEGNTGHMLQDVLFSTPMEKRADVHFLGRPECDMAPEEVAQLITALAGGENV